MSATPLSPAKRKQILRVIFISLLLDLVCEQITPWARLLTYLDLLYIYPSTLSQAPRILPQPRSPQRFLIPPQPGLRRPQCLQAILLPTHQRPL